MLFDELSRFTAVIHSYGALSQVTNLGILAIETALAEERRGALALRTLPVPASGPSISQQVSRTKINILLLATQATIPFSDDPYFPLNNRKTRRPKTGMAWQNLRLTTLPH